MVKKPKKKPRIKSTLKVIIEGGTEYKSFSAVWVDPKTVFENYLCQKDRSLGPKIKSKPNVRIEEKQKIKAVALHEYTQNNIWAWLCPSKWTILMTKIQKQPLK